MRRSLFLGGFLSLVLFGCSDDTVAKPDSRAPDRGPVADRAAGEAKVGDKGPAGEGKAGDKGQVGDKGAAEKGAADAAQAVTLKATLTGTDEVPTNSSTGTGSATITISADRTQITVALTFTGLTGVTASHIHVGAKGVSGPVILPLALAAFTSPLNKTLPSTDLTPQSAQGITTFADAVPAMLAGNTYVNIHTTAVPGGEIRGQIGP